MSGSRLKAPMRFFLFLLVNAMLFIRPGEAMPWLGDLPIYLACILCCLVVSLPAVLEMFRQPHPAMPPILACALGMLLIIPLSALANGRAEAVFDNTLDFFKTMVYLVLLVSLVNTPLLLRRFVGWIGLFSALTALLATIQYHGAIEIAQPKPVAGKAKKRGSFVKETYRDSSTGKVVEVNRMCGTGLFNDPNDLGLVLVTGVPIALFFLLRKDGGLLRFLWAVPLIVFLYALVLTHSRGSLLALMAGLAALFWLRFGWRRSVLAGLAVFPILLALFGGRMTEMSVNEGTGQGRIQLWAEGLAMLRMAPLWGVGMNQYVAHAGLVAHNSFIHCFGELGLIGGCLFLGTFAFAFLGMANLARQRERIEDPELRRLFPYLMAFLVAFLVGILFLSRSYLVPTYTILGLVVAYLRVAPSQVAPSREEEFPQGAFTQEQTRARLIPRPVWTLALVSLAFLLASETFVRVFVGGK